MSSTRRYQSRRAQRREEDSSPLLRAFADHPWLVAFGILGLVILGYRAWPARQHDREYWQALHATWEEFNRLRTTRAAEADWRQFIAKTEPLTAKILADLSATATSGAPAKRHLLWAARDCLPGMLADARLRPNRAEEKFLQHLDKADWYLKQVNR